MVSPADGQHIAPEMITEAQRHLQVMRWRLREPCVHRGFEGGLSLPNVLASDRPPVARLVRHPMSDLARHALRIPGQRCWSGIRIALWPGKRWPWFRAEALWSSWRRLGLFHRWIAPCRDMSGMVRPGGGFVVFCSFVPVTGQNGQRWVVCAPGVPSCKASNRLPEGPSVEPSVAGWLRSPGALVTRPAAMTWPG